MQVDMGGTAVGDVNVQAGQFVTLLIIALALGFDAFSLGLGIGLRGIRLRDTLKLSSSIALFHILMPLAGMWMGQLVSGLLGHLATIAAGVLLMLLGGHMIYNALRGEDDQTFNYRSSLSLFVIALSVSIDSFSVGITLGVFAAKIVMTLLLFGLAGGLMSVLGLMLGRRVSGSLGEYGEACGGAILLVFGLLFIV